MLIDNCYYLYNAQGDVTNILDENMQVIVTYEYDSWGKVLACEGTMASSLGKLNPFRYRGYIYDNETGFYYLDSRYYDPETGRFLNADVIFDYDVGLQGYNYYLYCGNNPINRIDTNGMDSVSIFDANDLLEQSVVDGGSIHHFTVDFSNAGNSSLVHGGIINCGYTIYSYSTPYYGSNNSSNTTALVPYYPPNNGAIAGTTKSIYLMAGTKIDRYGSKSGHYFSPKGTPIGNRSLSGMTDVTLYQAYEVVKPFVVEASIIAPAFGECGLGIQYYSIISASNLLKHGIIRSLK